MSKKNTENDIYKNNFNFSYNTRINLVNKDNIISRNFVLYLSNKYSNILWENGDHKYRVCLFLNEINDILSGEFFSSFNEELIDFLIGTLRERGNSNGTINRKMAALSKLLRKAHKMGEIHSLPEFRRQKERAGRIRFLELDEEERLFSTIRGIDEDSYRLSVFLVDTGARLGEAIGLVWNDTSDDRVTFWVTKSGRCRTVPLTARAKTSLRADKNGQPGPFAMLSQFKYRSVWNDAKAKVGLATDKEVVPHILRHTCASRLVQGGIDIRRVQMWLGHQTLQMTMRYAHLATNDLDSCVKILERSAR